MSILEQLPTRRDDAAANMATDQFLLELAPRCGAIRFRHYDWSGPAFTFGRLQRWSEVAELGAPLIAAGCAMVRRPSGGGIVDHRGDWTYALVIPPASPWFRTPPPTLYRLVHGALATALRGVGVPAGIHEEPSTARHGGACFARPERHDLVLADTGVKLGGAALRRSRTGLLLQGSILAGLLETDRQNREALASAAAASLAREFGLSLEASRFPPLPQSRYGSMLASFQSIRWNQSR